MLRIYQLRYKRFSQNFSFNALLLTHYDHYFKKFLRAIMRSQAWLISGRASLVLYKYAFLSFFARSFFQSSDQFLVYFVPQAMSIHQSLDCYSILQISGSYCSSLHAQYDFVGTFRAQFHQSSNISEPKITQVLPICTWKTVPQPESPAAD